MEGSVTEAHVQFISPPDIEASSRNTRGFSSAGISNRDSVVSRSRLASRLTYHHYTQSIYSEISRVTEDQNENRSEAPIPALDEMEGIKLIRHLNKGQKNDQEVSFYLEDPFTQSKKPFQALNWKLGSNNAFFFTCDKKPETIISPSTNAASDINFSYLIKEGVPDINAADVYFEIKGEQDKIGHISKYGGQDAEDIMITDNKGVLLYKMVEDLKPMNDNISCIVLDLLGNKIGTAELSFQENDILSCRIVFPQDTTSKQKVLIITAFLLKLIQWGIGVEWNQIQRTPGNEITSLDSCFFCFLRNK